MSALTDLIDRVTGVQQEAVAGSVVYPYGLVQTGNTLYWTNIVSVVPAVVASMQTRMTVSVQMRLHRGKLTETQSNPTLQTQCITDLETIVRQFMTARGRDLLSTTYPSRYPALVPQSAVVAGGQLAVIPAPDGTDHFGAVVTLTFAYMMTGV